MMGRRVALHSEHHPPSTSTLTNATQHLEGGQALAKRDAPGPVQYPVRGAVVNIEKEYNIIFSRLYIGTRKYHNKMTCLLCNDYHFRMSEVGETPPGVRHLPPDPPPPHHVNVTQPSRRRQPVDAVPRHALHAYLARPRTTGSSPQRWF